MKKQERRLRRSGQLQVQNKTAEISLYVRVIVIKVFQLKNKVLGLKKQNRTKNKQIDKLTKQEKKPKT